MLALQGDGGYPYAVPVNTVIGAGSVVTRFIPGNMLAVGVPCRVLREITEADKIPGLPDGMTGGFPKSRFHLLKNGRSCRFVKHIEQRTQ